MRIFPDANVLVANLLWDGVCAKIIDAIFLEHQHELVVGAWVWEETRHILQAKFKVASALIEAYEGELLGATSTTWQETPLALSPYPVADADDRVVLACALRASVDVLITGDQALLAVAKQVRQNENVWIVRPDHFWQRKGEVW